MEIAQSVFLLGLLILFSITFLNRREAIENFEFFKGACYVLTAAIGTHALTIVLVMGAVFGKASLRWAIVFQVLTGISYVIAVGLYFASLLEAKKKTIGSSNQESDESQN